jgi:D-serine deaminase-like pyridoxal phosphate-dependent protein
MLTRPTFLIDETKCRANIENMAKKAANNSLIFRPHFKTHQSLEIGNWFKEVGVTKIAVSSVEMAVYFSKEWNDITIAFPLNILEIDTINQLAKKITLNLLIENVASIDFLSKNIDSSVNIYLKIDVGLNRTGIDGDNYDLMDSILAIAEQNANIHFKGFLGHAGHTYKSKSGAEIRSILASSLEIMVKLKSHYHSKYPNLIVSLGDTPGCSLGEDFTGMDEMRPGNFVFYDLMQEKIGSCSSSQIAVAMSCPIVAIHKERMEVVIYGGGIHFSKDALMEDESMIFGRVVEEYPQGWGAVISGMNVIGLSQEHGIIKVPESGLEKYNIGDRLLILPVHSCMTANLMKSYLNGDKIITMLS